MYNNFRKSMFISKILIFMKNITSNIIEFNFLIFSKFQDIGWNIRRRSSSLAAYIEPELTAIVKAGTWKNERIITSPQRTRITLTNGKSALNFCANNYLGLAVKVLKPINQDMHCNKCTATFYANNLHIISLTFRTTKTLLMQLKPHWITMGPV